MDWKNETSQHFEKHAQDQLLPIYPWLLRDLENAVAKPIGDKSILEVGCGPGFMLPLFRKVTSGVICAIDMSSAMLASAAESGRAEKVHLIQGDCCALPFHGATFDIIFSRGSIFFWSDITAALVSINSILKPGGTVMIGGGYGISTPQQLIDSLHEQRKNQEEKKIPRIDTDSLLISAKQISENAELIQVKKRGFWLKWQSGAINSQG